MMWDYYVHLEQKVEEITSRLSQLEAQLKNKKADPEKQKEIRKEIERAMNEIRERFRQSVGGGPARTVASQLLDCVSLWWFREQFPCKEEVRRKIYMPIAEALTVSEPGKVSGRLDFRPNFEGLPLHDWLAFQADFELFTPWYSRDDRVFHVLDNPVRKDRVFGVPFMAASSWKGMLRWAFRMCTKLIGPEKETDEGKRRQAQAWELHLFGNEKGEEKNFHQGALVFYPTWFDRIGFEVINPHSRERRAGTKPIYYGVVPPGAKGTLSLLYAPWPGMKPAADPKEVLPKLLEAVETLLTNYGISAKRTVGWGTARIEKWRAFHKTGGTVEKNSRDELWQDVQAWFSGRGAP